MQPKHTKAPRTALYIRVSSEGQSGNYSPSTQEAGDRAFAARHGCDVDDAYVYREVFTGGSLWERPALSALRDAVRRRAVDAVIVYDLDRFTRKQTHLGVLLEEFDRHGVRLGLASSDEWAEDNPTARFLLQARAFAAELELEKIRERTNRGKRAKVAAGRLLHGPKARYGYRWVDGVRADGTPLPKARYEVDDLTAPIVQRIFTEYASGVSIRVVLKRLNNDGIPSPGGKFWSDRAVSRILSDPAYVGRPVAFAGSSSAGDDADRPQRATLPGATPRLVDDSLFNIAAMRLATNYRWFVDGGTVKGHRGC